MEEQWERTADRIERFIDSGYENRGSEIGSVGGQTT